jgi:hypothetical protein
MPASPTVNRRILSLPLAAAALLGSTLAVAGTNPATAAPEPGKLAVTGTMTGPDGEPLDGTLGIARRTNGSWYGFGNVLIDQGAISAALPPGEYRLTFSEVSGRYVTEYYADTTNWNAATTVAVNEAAVELDPVVLAPVHAVTGRVVDPVGRPAEGVQLQVVSAGNPNSWSTSTTTREDGSFRLTPYLGDWRLRLNDYDGRFATEWADDAASHATARTISFDGTADVAVGTLTVDGGGAISGTVTGDGGDPVRRVTVRAYDAVGHQVATASTDAAGRYVLRHLTAGAYKLQLSDDHGEYTGEWYGDATSSETATPVEVVGTGTTAAGISRLTGGPRQAPVGTDATGVVTDARGRPVMGAYVTAHAFHTSDGIPRQQVEYTTTGRDGRYYLAALDRVGPTPYKIRVQRYGDGEELGSRVAWLGGGPVDGSGGQPAVVTPGTVTTGLDVTLEQLGGIRGVVTDEAGRPLADVDVTLLDSSGRYIDDYGTNNDGSYSFTDVEPGVGHLIAFTDWEGHVPEWFDDATLPADARLVSARPGTWAVADAELASGLRARSAPAISGAPVVGRRLTASPGRWNLSAGTTFTTTWLRGGTVVGTGTSYVVTAADAGARLTARVRASAPGDAGGFTGTATTAPSATVRHASTTRLGGKAAGRTVTLDVVVTSAAKPAGTVVVRDGSKVVGRIPLKSGRGSLVLRKQRLGKHRYTASYAGSGTVAASAATVTVAVRK